jgi:hypothetical protein
LTAPAADGASADAGKSEADEKPEGQRGDKKSTPQRRGLGRGFWLYFMFMMAVLIPLNLFCLSNVDQGPGEVQEGQDSPLLESIGSRHEPYETDPPTSGPRAPDPTAYGFHEETIADEVQVATLCAGYVIVHYNPSGGAALDAEMRRLADELEGYDVVVHPDRDLGEAEVVMTAFRISKRLENYDEAQVYDFVMGYAGLRLSEDLCPSAPTT